LKIGRRKQGLDMPTYTYETLPSDDRIEARRFDVRQRFDDPVLLTDPETGIPVRRVISGGLAAIAKSEATLPEPGPGCGPGSCGCGRF
jgi:predicted nucleic acid-binding Zn ribbon protein